MKRIVYAPDPVGIPPATANAIVSVFLKIGQRVTWTYTHHQTGSYVSGYTIHGPTPIDKMEE